MPQVFVGKLAGAFSGKLRIFFLERQLGKKRACVKLATWFFVFFFQTIPWNETERWKSAHLVGGFNPFEKYSSN